MTDDEIEIEIQGRVDQLPDSELMRLEAAAALELRRRGWHIHQLRRGGVFFRRRGARARVFIRTPKGGS